MFEALLLAFMPTDAGPRIPTPGYAHFCRDYASLCSGIAGPSVIPYSDAIARVNADVNAAIEYRADGAQDVWTVEPKAGDCEDYAVTKLARLLALGVPRSAMKIGIGKIERGEYHAVLLVYTHAGIVVLNNLEEPIAQWIAGESFSYLGYSSLHHWR
jgi:predicted transglutaminase-like cysteine proteinase